MKTPREVAQQIAKEWCDSIGLSSSTILVNTLEAALEQAAERERILWGALGRAVETFEVRELKIARDMALAAMAKVTKMRGGV